MDTAGGKRRSLGTFLVVITSGVMALGSSLARATEGGGSIYPPGAENYGCCALPPPGLYGEVYGEQYNASTIRDNNGDQAPVTGFRVSASAVVPRLIWVTELKVLGGALAFHTIIPLVSLGVDAAGASQRKTGVGDIDFGTAVGWHPTSQLSTLVAVDVFAPTGGYDKSNLANIGRNYWAVQPIVGFSQSDPSGLNADMKVMYTFNGANTATEYHSGQELIVDYSIGYGIFKHWVLGVGGYYYLQTTDDTQYGSNLPGRRGRSLAVGPSIKYDSGKGWFITLKYETETMVRNRSDGGAFWLKAAFPLR